MNSICYLRARSGTEAPRIGPEAITLHENDLDHAEWRLDPGALPDGAVARVHRFCAAQGLAPPDWSVMAARRY